jgi:hypothetical protein
MQVQVPLLFLSILIKKLLRVKPSSTHTNVIHCLSPSVLLLQMHALWDIHSMRSTIRSGFIRSLGKSSFSWLRSKFEPAALSSNGSSKVSLSISLSSLSAHLNDCCIPFPSHCTRSSKDQNVALFCHLLFLDELFFLISSASTCEEQCSKLQNQAEGLHH